MSKSAMSLSLTLLTALGASVLPLASAGYVTISSQSCAYSGYGVVASFSDCSAAGRALGYGGAVMDYQSVSYDPLGCYYESSTVKFNGAGNTGPCSATDRCICETSTGTSTAVTGVLRLVATDGSTGGSTGQLQYSRSGAWGTVCDDSFGPADGGVACRQLGSSYVDFENAWDSGLNYPTNVSILVDNLACSGTETRLADCTHHTSHNCGHNEDVILTCTGPTADVYYNGTNNTVNGTQVTESNSCTGYYSTLKQPDGCQCYKNGGRSDRYCKSGCCADDGLLSRCDDCPVSAAAIVGVVIGAICCCMCCFAAIGIMMSQNNKNSRVAAAAPVPLVPLVPVVPAVPAAVPAVPTPTSSFPSSASDAPPSYGDVATMGLSAPPAAAPAPAVGTAQMVDTTGDGKADAALVDTNGDGVPDSLVKIVDSAPNMFNDDGTFK